MYIIHSTYKNHLYNILKTGFLLPSSVTGHVEEGSGIYKKSPYVYFTTCKNVPSDLHNMGVGGGGVVLVFDSKILQPKKFCTTLWHAVGISEASTCYPKNYNKTDEVLEKLYKYSISRLSKPYVWQVFQQVLIRGKASLKYLKHIYIGYKTLSDKKYMSKISKYLSKYYPEVKLIKGQQNEKMDKFFKKKTNNNTKKTRKLGRFSNILLNNYYKQKYKKYKEKYLRLKEENPKK